MSGFKFEYLKALHGKRFPRGVRLTLVTILDYANADGENAYPGEERLAADCCVSVRTIQRHIAWLLENGWLIEVSRGRKYGGASVYSVSYGSMPGETDAADEKPADDASTATYPEPFVNVERPVAGQPDTVADLFSTAAQVARGKGLIESGRYAPRWDDHPATLKEEQCPF